jgi:cytochrome b pre-mRNA-processing protein 3
MIFHPFRRAAWNDTIAALYGAIVAQARAAAFYRVYGVPDTINGRFEMIVLHAVLLLRRLESEPKPLRRLGQALFDLFCRDMDASLRELGVGDLAVPAKMRKIGEAFYSRQAAYGAALAASQAEPLVAALTRNIFDADADRGAARLAAYVRAAARQLAEQDGNAFAHAKLSFPDPEAMAFAAIT